MKNKKFLIIAILAIIIIAIIIGVNVTNKKVGDFLFSTDGTVVDGHKDLINQYMDLLSLMSTLMLYKLIIVLKR